MFTGRTNPDLNRLLILIIFSILAYHRLPVFLTVVAERGSKRSHLQNLNVYNFVFVVVLLKK